VSPLAVSSVRFVVDGADQAVLNWYPYEFPWNTLKVADGPHRIELVATDVLGTSSSRSFQVNVRNDAGTLAAISPPGPITGFRTARVTASQIVFQWNPAEDYLGPSSYVIYRDGLPVGTAGPDADDGPLSFSDTGLTPGTVYSYQVLAIDRANNRSALSSPLAITTKAKDGNILRVGPGATYARPCDAIRAAAAFDTIEIDAAGNDTFDGDACQFKIDNLTIRGVNGRARVDALGQSAGDKATWVVMGANNTVENIELSGAISVSSGNGAAIRVEGPGLTLRNVYFHHNQDGILTADVGGTLLIEYSEFAFNGDGSGQTHNMYINNVDRFTLQFSYSHDALIGHLVKTRALENYIIYNRLTGETGTESYEIDAPNGGPTYVIGNLIEQSAQTDNNIFVSYGIEGIPASRASSLYLINNTFVNDYPSCALLHMPDGAQPATVENNLLPPCDRMAIPPAGGQLLNNVIVDHSAYVDPADYDYRPQANFAGQGAGAPVATPAGQSLTPVFEYAHPAGGRVRPVSPALDAGAYQTDAGAAHSAECKSGSALPCLVRRPGPRSGTDSVKERRQAH
jgi:hypothetical protein